MAASANLGDHHMMFEPVHGSAPKHAGEKYSESNSNAFVSAINAGKLGYSSFR